MNFVRSNLAVCGFRGIGTPDQFRRLGFQAQLQCAEAFDPWLAECLEVKALPFADAAPIPAAIFSSSQAWLVGHWDQGSRIFISCAGGASRSVTMAAALLALKTNLSFLGATAELMEKVPDAYPHPMVLVSASLMCGEPLALAELQSVYASKRAPPRFPWSEALLGQAIELIHG